MRYQRGTGLHRLGTLNVFCLPCSEECMRHTGAVSENTHSHRDQVCGFDSTCGSRAQLEFVCRPPIELFLTWIRQDTLIKVRLRRNDMRKSGAAHSGTLSLCHRRDVFQTGLNTLNSVALPWCRDDQVFPRSFTHTTFLVGIRLKVNHLASR